MWELTNSENAFVSMIHAVWCISSPKMRLKRSRLQIIPTLTSARGSLLEVPRL
jgi:hypothetical protein